MSTSLKIVGEVLIRFDEMENDVDDINEGYEMKNDLQIENEMSFYLSPLSLPAWPNSSISPLPPITPMSSITLSIWKKRKVK